MTLALDLGLELDLHTFGDSGSRFGSIKKWNNNTGQQKLNEA